MYAVFNISEEIITGHQAGVVFQNNNEKTIAVLWGENADSLQETAVAIGEEIRQSVEKYLMFAITIGIGNTCLSLPELETSFRGAVSALDYRFLLGKNQVISIRDMEGTRETPSPYNTEWEKKLISAVKTCTPDEIDRQVDNIIHSLQESYTSVRRSYIHIQYLVVSVMDTLSELGVEETAWPEGDQNSLTEVYRLKTLEEVGRWLRSFCKKACSFLSGRREDYSRTQAKEAQEFIQANYMNEDMSLQIVCKHLLMSTSYFSMVFKTYTGETFVEYLTRVRIEKAMELLRTTSLRTYEIAHEVGYADPHYFSLAFKKATGMTTTEYREQGQR